MNALMQKKPIVLMSLGHLCTDLNQGALPALLPFLIASRHFTYATAAGLVFMANLASSLTQPVFGHLADRYQVSWLVPLGILTAVTGVVLTALMPTYWAMLLTVALSGMGVAAFHPEAALIVKRFSGARRATAMSVFAVGGNLGFAVGPLLTTACVLWLGFRGALLMVAPGLVTACLIVALMPRVSTAASAAIVPGTVRKPDAWGPFAWLTGTVICRSIVFFGTNTFVALYWISRLHQSKSAGNTALSILLFAGAAGTLLGGPLADKYGRGRVLSTSLFLVPFAILAFLGATNHLVLATVLLLPIGVLLSSPFGLMVVMSQDFLPNHPGVASGVDYGLATSIGGIATPLFGRIADHRGVPASFLALAMVGCAGFLLSLATVRAGNNWKLRQAREAQSGTPAFERA